MVEGPRLFNSLPRTLRNTVGTLTVFKTHLDKYLEMIPDQPAFAGSVPGALDMNAVSNNSIKDLPRTLWIEVLLLLFHPAVL